MIDAPDWQARSGAEAHLDTLTKPPGSLGRLEELVVWAAGVQGQSPPQPFRRPRLIIVAGDHGVASRTSAYPPEVTAQMVANFLSGGAAANVLADRADVGVRVVDACVDSDYDGLGVPEGFAGSRVKRCNGAIDVEDALTPAELEVALALGAQIADDEIDSGADIVLVGDMGIGNTTPAAALVARFTGSEAAEVCGRGTGIDDATWMRKTAAIRDALWRSREATAAGDVLRAIGGADLAVMAGVLRRAAQRGVPAILDGVVVTAAALAADALEPDCRAWWLAGHRSVEPAHTIALAHLDLEPVVDLRMRLGEGSGALMAIPVLQAAIDVANQMATFTSAGVSTGHDDEAE